MKDLEKRIAKLELDGGKTDEGTGFDFAPVMGYDEWCEAARLQQAALIKDVYENA